MSGVWGAAPWADVLVDLRTRPQVDLAGLDRLNDWGPVAPGLSVQAHGVREMKHGAALETAVFRMVDSDARVSVAVAMDARGAANATTAIGEMCPGLWRYGRVWVWGRKPENPHDGHGDLAEKRLWQAWEKRAVATSTVHAKALFAALRDPAPWLDGAPATWNERVAAKALVKWSPVAANAGEAYAWSSSGLRDPLDVVAWRWAGWNDDEDIRRWGNTGASLTVAGSYRDAGLSAEQAGVWFRNAKRVSPVAARALASAGISASAGKALHALVEQETGVVDVEGELVGWAESGLAKRAQVELCVRAGLGPGEIAVWVEGGSMDWDAVRALAALRRGVA